MNAAASPRLRVAGLGKSFSGVTVLSGVSFTVGAGRITGLVGENGAGKSTLMNLLGGNVPPDAGTMELDGGPHRPADPAAARRAGVAFVHQELNLFPNLSLAENLFLTGFPTAGPLIRRRELHRRASALLVEVGLALDPGTPLGALSAGEQQLVEVARALAHEARLLILDEPTTSLTAREAERLFALLGRLRARGLSLIYISHVLPDVLRLADDLVVLRDGRVVAAGPRAEFEMARLVSLMVGRELSQLYPVRAGRPAADPVLEVCGVTEPGIVRDISFTLHRGEVLGVAGLMGAGRSELARILFGLDPCARGEILVEGRTPAAGPRGRIRHATAFLTEDRRADGLCLDAAIADNLALVTLRTHARGPAGWLDRAGLHAVVTRIREAVRLQPRLRDGQPARTLSGGSQQKVVLGKWLLAAPRVLLLDEPTRGIDVGARFEIYQLIHQLADGGAGVLVISSQTEELMGLCDRLLVMNRGRLAAEFARPDFNREHILAAALPEEKAA